MAAPKVAPRTPAPTPEPNIDVDAQVDTKPEVMPDTGLMEIYTRYNEAQGELRKVGQRVDTILVEVVEYVKSKKLSRAVVRATLEKRGLSESSTNSELSRIFKFASTAHEETFQQLKDGTISTADARKLIVSKPQQFPRAKRGIHDRVFEALFNAARAAINDLKADEGEKIFNSQSDFTAVASEAWQKAWAEQAAKVNEGAKAPEPAQAAA